MSTFAGQVVVKRLTTATGAVAYAGSRVYPFRLPQKPTLPAYTYQVLNALREHAMGGDEGTVHARVQVDIYDRSYLGTTDGSKWLREALSRWHGTATGTVVHEVFVDDERDAFEERLEGDERVVWRRSMDLTVHYVEEE